MFNRSDTVQGGSAIYDTQKTLAEKIAKRRVKQMQTETSAFNGGMEAPPAPEPLPAAQPIAPTAAVQPGQTVNAAPAGETPPVAGNDVTTQERLRRIAQSRRSIGI